MSKIKLLLDSLPNTLRQRIIKCVKDHYVASTFIYKIYKENSNRFDGKNILITGATGAIGTALCLKFASEGAIVGVAGRSQSKIDRCIKNLMKISSDFKLQPVLLDVTNEESIQHAVADFAKDNNMIIDALINNAGGGERERKNELLELPTTVIDEILNTNLRGTILCSKYVLRYMKPANKGKIINLSSVMGMNGKETMCAYSSSKAGILGFTKSLALESGNYHICVNSVSPGMVFQRPFDRIQEETFTSTNCLHRFGYTDEVANLIAFLTSDEANYITGQNFVIDGGRSIGLK